jgi:hypothetical protein
VLPPVVAHALGVRPGVVVGEKQRFAELHRSRDRSVEGLERASVRKTIRSDVEDAHYQGTAKWEGSIRSRKIIRA